MNQREFIYNYNDTHKHQFNDFLFDRDEDGIILALKKIILSFQRDKTFIIKVKNFRVVEDYGEILEIMRDYEKSKRKSYNKGRTRDKDLDVLIVPSVEFSKSDIFNRFSYVVVDPVFSSSSVAPSGISAV